LDPDPDPKLDPDQHQNVTDPQHCPKRMEGERGNRASVSALSAGAYTATLYVTRLKGGGRAPPTLTNQG
jgi:hypothetical protein